MHSLYHVYMDTRIYEHFLKIADLQNISKAAEKLNITQPTLSRQLMELEQSVGIQLFERVNRKMVLTQAGLIFYKRAQEILELIKQNQKDLIENKDVHIGKITIGCVESSISPQMAKWIQNYTKKYPLVQFDIVSANGDDLRDKLDQGLLDCALLLEPIEFAKYHNIKLPFFERQGIILPKKNPIAIKGYVEYQDLKEIPIIVSSRSIVLEDVLSYLNVQNEDLHIVAYQNLLSNSLTLAQIGFGYPITVEGAFQLRAVDDLMFTPFKPEKKLGHILVWKKNRIQQTITNLFIEEIKNYTF